MRKILSAALVLFLGGCCCRGSLFDGPECNRHREVLVPAQQPCVAQVVQPIAARHVYAAGVIYFADGSDYLNPAEIAQLGRIAQIARSNNAIVKIAGHASHKVNIHALNRKDAINRDISSRRVLKVANTLAGMGVNPQMMTGAAYSDYQPVAIETDARGEALNRRVEIFMEY
ncbi:MAG: OmpA family protein [Alphaproteobacteria bacterium]|nr:OmpA family protein [Alphaproteobacteria bacterium]